MGGVNMLMHGSGWMEGGLHASFEKAILDAELLGMVEAFLDPVPMDEDSLAFEAMADRLVEEDAGRLFHQDRRARVGIDHRRLAQRAQLQRQDGVGPRDIPTRFRP